MRIHDAEAWAASEILIVSKRSRQPQRRLDFTPERPGNSFINWTGTKWPPPPLQLSLSASVNCWANTGESISQLVNAWLYWLIFSPHQRAIAFLIGTQAAEALPSQEAALTPTLGSMSNVEPCSFDLLPRKMNRAGSALSIIYAHSFSVSCLSAPVAVTCPDSNGERPGENIYQCYCRVLCSSALSFSAFWNLDY